MNRHAKPPHFTNHAVEDGGRTYRVCLHHSGRVLCVALKHKRGRETFLDIDGRRARKLIAMVEA